MRTTKRNKDLKTKKNEMPDIIPSIYRKPGFGAWSASVNGYSRFLEAAIRHFKEAAARCADEGLDEEYKIFAERARELQDELKAHELANEE